MKRKHVVGTTDKHTIGETRQLQSTHNPGGEVVIDYSYSSGHTPELMNVTVTAPGGIPRELIHRRDQFQLQCSIPAEFIKSCSTAF